MERARGFCWRDAELGEIDEKSPGDSVQSQTSWGDELIYLLLRMCVPHPAGPATAQGKAQPR